MRQIKEYFTIGDSTLVGLDEFIKYNKGICATVNDLLQRNPALKESKYSSLVEVIKESWDTIPKLTVKDALDLLEVHELLSRDAFVHIDIPTVYASIKSKSIVHTYDDSKLGKYVLWTADLTEIGFTTEYSATKVLQMWCPSTNQEYWVLVHSDLDKANEAVAWMCRTWYTEDELKAIYRQGEVFHFYCHEDKVAEMTESEWEKFKRQRASDGFPRHLDWDEYQRKLVIQT